MPKKSSLKEKIILAAVLALLVGSIALWVRAVLWLGWTVARGLKW